MKLTEKLTSALGKVAGGAAGGVKAGADVVRATADGVVQGVTGAYQLTVKTVDDTVLGARNLAADAVSYGGNLAGFTAGFAGEVALFGATGGIGYIAFGGMPLQLGMEFAQSCDRFSTALRGDRPQFMGVNHYKESDGLFTFGHHHVLAVVYDPFNIDKDSGGFVRLDERQVMNTYEEISPTDDERRAVYLAALAATQDLKKRMNIGRDLPDLRCDPEESRSLIPVPHSRP